MKTVTDRERQQARSAKRRKAMVDLYLAGNTLKEVGEHFGISRERVRQVLVMEGIDMRNGHSLLHERQCAALLARKDEVLAVYRSGKKLRAMAKQFDTTLPALQELVAAEASEMDQRRRRSAAANSTPVYSDAKIRASLLEAHAYCGDEHLSAARYDQWRSAAMGRKPSSLTITKRHKTWGAALESVGMQAREVPKGFGVRSYTDDEMLDAVDHVRFLIDELPSVDRYERLRASSDPSAPAIRNRFDTWMKMFEALEARA